MQIGKAIVNNSETATKLLNEGLKMNFLKYKVVENRSHVNVTQCFNCQQFGHVSKSYKNQVKCVKCGENHNVKKCTKTSSDQSFCSNCNGDHTSNFAQCPLFQQEIMKKKQTNFLAAGKLLVTL